jgi:hypothetical protein
MVPHDVFRRGGCRNRSALEKVLTRLTDEAKAIDDMIPTALDSVGHA